LDRIGRQQREIMKLLLRRGGFARVRVVMSALFDWKGTSSNGKVFDRTFVGSREYDLRHASLSRSLRRLQEMGVLEVFKSANAYVTAVGLTAAGVALAQEIFKREEEEAE
jgi:hypothetical protein